MFVDQLRIFSELATRAVSGYFSAARWYPSFIAFGGYGSLTHVRILGRTLMSKTADERYWLENRRGWRQYFDVETPRQPVLLVVGKAVELLNSDSGGYIDAVIPNHDLAPGFHAVHAYIVHRGDLETHLHELLEGEAANALTPEVLARRARKLGVRLSPPTRVPVRIIGDTEKVGVLSDVDDSIVVTDVPRPLRAARNAFITRPSDRTPVTQMPIFLQSLRREALQASGTTTAGWPSTRADGPVPSLAAPVMYLSTGAWNTAPMLRKFLRHSGFPLGTVILRPWGITDRGLPPSGITHKLGQFEKLATLVPQVKWLLIGDDGQHDPRIFAELARRHPEQIAAVFIRTLSPTEHLVSHGTPGPLDKETELPPEIPVYYGSDGGAFLDQINTSQFRDQLRARLAQ